MKHPLSTRLLLSALPVLVLAGMPQAAHATKKVYGPYVDPGEVEIEWRGSYSYDDDDDEQDGEQKNKFALGYGVTERWFTELYIELEKAGDSDDYEAEALEWENLIQLTEPGQYWADFGVLVEAVHSLEGGDDKIEGALLVAKDIGKFSHTLNLKLEKEFGGETEAGASWSSRYRYKPEFEPGIEIYSDFGDLDEDHSFDEQGHQIGPVAYGQLGQHVGYDIGYLVGVSDSAPDGEFKWTFEYEWRF